MSGVLDADEDGINDIDEFFFGSDPLSSDTDGDLLRDAEELENGSDPIWSDTDEDGLSDYAEGALGAGVTEPDTDGDGFLDGDEFIERTDLLDPNSKPDLGRQIVGYWQFDKSIDDFLGSSESRASPSGARLEYADPGVVGSALRLDGTQFIEIGGREGIDMQEDFGFENSSFSISCWVQLEDPVLLGDRFLLNSPTGRQWHLSANWETSPDSNGWSFFVPRGEVQINVLSRLNQWPVLDGRWHHLVASYRSPKGGYGDNLATPSLFINGRPVEISDAKTFSIPRYDPKSNEVLYVGGFPDALNRQFWIGSIDDLAIWSRELTVSEIGAIYRGAIQENKSIGELLSPDSDSDFMPDIWEIQNGLSPTVPDGHEDPDLDSLSNLEEYSLGLNPNSPDTDKDGFLDGVESDSGLWAGPSNTGTNPRDSDSDGDGLLDGSEMGNIGVDPNLMDTDGDGVADPFELRYGSDPARPESLPDIGDGLVAYWSMNADSTADYGPAVDVSVNGAVSLADGVFGESVFLNGEDQALTCSSLRLSSEAVSVSVWFKMDRLPDNCLLSKEALARALELEQDELPRCAFEAGLVSMGAGQWINTRVLGAGGVRFGDLLSVSPVELGEWHHLVGVRDAVSKSVSLYLNGVLASKGTLAPTSRERFPIAIGASRNSDGDLSGYFAGQIDDVAIWNRPLSSNEIVRLAESSLGSIANLGLDIDTDSDGMADSSEFRAGTDFANNSDYLHVEVIERNDSRTLIRWRGVRGKSYRVRFTESLDSPVWEDVGIVSNIGGGVVEIVHDDSERGIRARLYRVEVVGR